MNEQRLTVCCLECRLIQFLPERGACRKCGHRIVRILQPVRICKPKILKQERKNHNYDFADCIAFSRQQFNLSQNDLSKITGVLRTYISRLENRKIVDVRVRTAARLGFSFQNFFMGRTNSAILFAAETLMPERIKQIFEAAKEIYEQRKAS